MAGEAAQLVIDAPQDGAARARVSGVWTFGTLRARGGALARELEELQQRHGADVVWDLSGLELLDDAGAVWLARALAGAQRIEVPQRHRELLQQASESLLVPRVERGSLDPLNAVAAIGRAAFSFASHMRAALTLLGQLVLDFAYVVRHPRYAPLREFSANVYHTGVSALPVTMLVGFLVGIVLTYLSALQLKRYGADLLVINIVGVGVLRELGPMLASIIAAGRSGSAMTAQLGVMRVTEEIEALSVMGVSITTRLVLPKVLGLAIALPLVTFCTDIAALAGGMLVSRFTLGITPAAFLEALPRAVEIVNFWIGIGKAAAFGLVVALVACHYGLRVLPNTDSLAVGVTRSVVAAITAVIVLDAIFAVLLRNVG
jgi:phospholipid/cholesterol/gamma-HCH transport system permease protein